MGAHPGSIQLPCLSSHPLLIFLFTSLLIYKRDVCLPCQELNKTCSRPHLEVWNHLGNSTQAAKGRGQDSCTALLVKFQLRSWPTFPHVAESVLQETQLVGKHRDSAVPSPASKPAHPASAGPSVRGGQRPNLCKLFASTGWRLYLIYQVKGLMY